MFNKEVQFGLSNTILYLLLYLFISVLQYYSQSILIIFIFILGVLITLFNRYNGFLFFIISVFIFDDYPLNLEQMDSFSTLDGVMVMNQTLTKIWSIFFLAIIFFDLLKEKRSIPKDYLFRSILFILFISFAVGFLNLNEGEISPFINDLRFFINFFVGYFGIILYVKEHQKIYNILKILALIFLGKLIVLVPNIISISSQEEFFIAVGDSGFIFAPTMLLLYYTLIKDKSSLILYFAIFLCVISFGLSVSRGKIILLVFQLVVFFYIIGKLKKLPIIIISVSGLIFLVVPFISESIFNALIWKIQSFIPDANAAQSSIVRLIEYQNIINQNLDSVTEFFFGQGIGGSWNSEYARYPFILYDTDSYPDEWISNDVFYKPHGIIQFIILKFGFLGFFLIFFSLGYYIFKCKKFLSNIIHVKETSNFYLIPLLLSSVCSLFLISYSSKHQLFLGVFLAIFSLCRSNFLIKNSTSLTK